MKEEERCNQCDNPATYFTVYEFEEDGNTIKEVYFLCDFHYEYESSKVNECLSYHEAERQSQKLAQWHNLSEFPADMK